MGYLSIGINDNPFFRHLSPYIPYPLKNFRVKNPSELKLPLLFAAYTAELVGQASASAGRDYNFQ